MTASQTFEIETSLTLDYRKSGWGLERIVVDAVSNHLPDDSKGTTAYVRVKQEGQWVELKQADRGKPIEEVMMGDNGRGYTSRKLATLRSTKLADVLSVGQFGEGLKLVAAAALRHGLSLEYRSRNWHADPFRKPEVDDGETYDRLCFRVTENGDHLGGSRTIFTNPNREFLDELFRLPEKVLAMNDTYKELHNEKSNYNLFGVLFAFKFRSPGYHSRIIDLGTEDRAIFVKGIRIQKSVSIFSYDLGIEDVTPDRGYANQEKVLDEMEMLLRGCTNYDVIATILQRAKDESSRDYEEFRALSPTRKQKNEKDSPFSSLNKIFELKEISGYEKLFQEKFDEEKANKPWVQAFKKLYGENAVLSSSDTNVNTDTVLLGFRPVKLHHAVETFLEGLGIDTADHIARGKKEYRWVDIADLTMEERAIYERIPELNLVAFGDKEAIPWRQVRIYEGMFFPSGLEVESDRGVTIREEGQKYIGIKRKVLQDQQEFGTTYFHEAGHYLTGAWDASREHANFGYAGMARLAWEKIDKGQQDKR